MIDQPISFGYQCAWYAVRTSDVQQVAKVVGVRGCRAASWVEGVEKAYDGEVFVAPPVDGWTLVVSSSFAESVGDANQWQLLTDLSDAFGEAQAFCTHRVVDLHVWARAVDGRLVRAYGYLGESGETLFNVGSQSEEEVALNFHFFDESDPAASDDAYWERTDLVFPSEGSVMSIAGQWSVAPDHLAGKSAEAMAGVLGQR